MPSRNTQAEIRARVDAFVDDLTDLIHQAALESVSEVLAGQGFSAPARPAAQGPRRKKKVSRRAGRAVDTATVLDAIRSMPGSRTELIAKSLGTNSMALKPAIDALVADGMVTRRGKARGTTLHPSGGAGGGGIARKAKKTSRKKKKRGRKKTRRSTNRG